MGQGDPEVRDLHEVRVHPISPGYLFGELNNNAIDWILKKSNYLKGLNSHSPLIPREPVGPGGPEGPGSPLGPG